MVLPDHLPVGLGDTGESLDPFWLREMLLVTVLE